MLNEAVIRRVVGGASAMRKQLDHITEMAKLPHVNVQVLPFSAGVHPAMEGAFRILGFPESADPDVVYPGVILRYLMGRPQHMVLPCYLRTARAYSAAFSIRAGSSGGVSRSATLARGTTRSRSPLRVAGVAWPLPGVRM